MGFEESIIDIYIKITEFGNGNNKKENKFY